jgi:hypothetical protein
MKAPSLCLVAIASLTGLACEGSLDLPEPSSDVVGEIQQPLVTGKRRVTYKLRKGSDGFYAPLITWLVNATPEQLTANGVVPAGVSMTRLTQTLTQVQYPRLANAYVEERWNNALAGWASVTNLEFVKVSGRAELELILNQNAEAGNPLPTYLQQAEGYASGGEVVINMMYEMTASNPPYWQTGSHIPALLQPGYESRFDTVAMHEVGHFLGLGHAFDDFANYGRDHRLLGTGNELRGCTSTPCFGLGHDLAVMDYATQNRVLINGWDIFKVRQLYGTPKHNPVIEMFIPFMANGGEYFYTNSWDEASQLLHRYFDQGVRFNRVVGVTYQNSGPSNLRTAINRYYDPIANGHSITYGTTLPSPAIFEGIMGYAANGSTPDLLQLGLYQVNGTSDYRFFHVGQAPGDVSDTGVRYGYTVPRENIGKRGALADGGFYRIVNRTSGKAMDVVANSTANGAKLNQWSYVGAQNQQFRFRETGDGLYAIFVRSSGKSLEFNGASAQQLDQWDHSELAHQEFLVESLSNGYYRLRVRYNGRCVENPGGSLNNGTIFEQRDCGSNNQNQEFSIQKVDQDLSEARQFRIVNRGSNKALDVSGSSTADGAAVQQWSYGGNDNQKWSLSPSSPGYVTVTAKHSGKLLSIVNSTADGAAAEQRGASSPPLQRQEFSLQATGDGFFRLRPRHSNKCLDVSGGSNADGAKIQQWTCVANNAQQFALVQAE